MECQVYQRRVLWDTREHSRLLRPLLVPPFSSVSGARGKTSSVSLHNSRIRLQRFSKAAGRQAGRQAIIAVIKCGSSDEQLYRRAILDSSAVRGVRDCEVYRTVAGVVCLIDLGRTVASNVPAAVTFTCLPGVGQFEVKTGYGGD